MILGFLLSTISQVPVDNQSYDYVFWIASAICVVLTLHVMLNAVYLTVFGQGLALRGPPGSMVKAVNGMVVEQGQVLIAFSANIFFLGISTAASYFMVMDRRAAWTCAGITAAGMVMWHRTSSR